MRESNFWDQTAADYSSGRTKGRDYVLDPALLGAIGDVEGIKILDVACGAGAITIPLAKRGAICTGIDYSRKLIDQARIKALDLKLNIDFRVLDAREIRTLQYTYDLIVISLLFPHLKSKEDIHNVVKQSSELLSSGGRLVLAEPHPSFDFYMRNRLESGDFNYFESGLSYEFSMNIRNKELNSTAFHWTLEDYFSALVENGFEVDKIIEPKPTVTSKSVDENWYRDKSRYPSYIIFDCVRK